MPQRPDSARPSNPGVATIAGTGAGAIATGVSIGTTTITATYGVCSPNEHQTVMLVFNQNDAGASTLASARGPGAASERMAGPSCPSMEAPEPASPSRGP